LVTLHRFEHTHQFREVLIDQDALLRVLLRLQVEDVLLHLNRHAELAIDLRDQFLDARHARQVLDPPHLVPHVVYQIHQFVLLSQRTLAREPTQRAQESLQERLNELLTLFAKDRLQSAPQETLLENRVRKFAMMTCSLEEMQQSYEVLLVWLRRTHKAVHRSQ
jgi:hypothetical protein